MGTTELIRRLRNEGSDAFRKQYSLGMWTLCVEAADQIEHLQKQLGETRERWLAIRTHFASGSLTAVMWARRNRMAVDRDYWMAVAGERKVENEKLRAALCILYADCADYIRVNNLYRGDGKSAIWNQAMRQAADALGIAHQQQAGDK